MSYHPCSLNIYLTYKKSTWYMIPIFGGREVVPFYYFGILGGEMGNYIGKKLQFLCERHEIMKSFKWKLEVQKVCIRSPIFHPFACVSFCTSGPCTLRLGYATLSMFNLRFHMKHSKHDLWLCFGMALFYNYYFNLFKSYVDIRC